MKVTLAYGRSGLEVEFPADRTTVIEPGFELGLESPEAAIRSALGSPIGSAPLGTIVPRGARVVVSICDVTRAMPHQRLLPVLLEELEQSCPESITFLVATGTHRNTTRPELVQMLGQEILARYPVVNHDCEDDSELVKIGTTRSGIPAWINRRWVEADFRITTGFVEPHFFAGFSGGPKLVAPGLAGLDTVMGLHSARMIADPRATWGVTVGNPMHDAIREIASMAGVGFIVDVILNARKEITGVFAGAMESAHAAACVRVKSTAMQPVDGLFDVVVTTNSGYPLDLNLYQAVKGMSAAARVVSPGGTIICAAECSDGVPDHGAYGRLLAEAQSVDELLERIEGGRVCCRDQWQAQVQGLVQRKARVLVKSQLPAETVRGALLEPVEDLERTVVEELERRGPAARVCVLPEGPQTIPYSR